jgi:hypothetical protein
MSTIFLGTESWISLEFAFDTHKKESFLETATSEILRVIESIENIYLTDTYVIQTLITYGFHLNFYWEIHWNGNVTDLQ